MLAVMNSTTYFHPMTSCHTQSFDSHHILGIDFLSHSSVAVLPLHQVLLLADTHADHCADGNDRSCSVCVWVGGHSSAHMGHEVIP